ncbi:hypothetical protein [Pollutibacter soli]|uniref:hypothetical protein n=1 Tax=Pollutibacter soli TaxID=3034157 RepID=UPI003013797B
MNLRLIKPLLIGILGVLSVVTLISLLLPSQVMTSKWVQVAAGKDTILNNIRDLNQWKDWNGLLTNARDIQVVQKTSLTDTGSRIFWTDLRDYHNEIRVTGNNEKGLVTNLYMGNQRPMTSGFSVEKRHPDSVQVVWYIVENLKWYPWEKFYGMMSGDMKGPVMQESLYQLKKRLQTQ